MPVKQTSKLVKSYYFGMVLNNGGNWAEAWILGEFLNGDVASHVARAGLLLEMEKVKHDMVSVLGDVGPQSGNTAHSTE